MLAGVVTIGNPFPRHGGFDAVVKNIIQWAQETPPPRAAKWSTISASGGQADAVRSVSTFQTGGWTSKVDMISTPPRLFSQTAETSPLWSETSAKRRIRRETTRIFRVHCGKAKRDCASRIPLPSGAAARCTRGVQVEGADKLTTTHPLATTGTRRTVASIPDV